MPDTRLTRREITKIRSEAAHTAAMLLTGTVRSLAAAELDALLFGLARDIVAFVTGDAEISEADDLRDRFRALLHVVNNGFMAPELQRSEIAHITQQAIDAGIWTTHA